MSIEVIRTARWGITSIKYVEEAIGLEGDNVTADRELSEKQWSSLFVVARVNRAEDLGSPRRQLHPRRVRMLRQSGRDRRCGTWSAADADSPVGPAEALGVELAYDPNDTSVEETSVAAGDGLLGGSEDL
jgi:hypothetical protein